MARKSNESSSRGDRPTRADRRAAKKAKQLDARRSEQPAPPDSWRSVVRTDYDYPDELDELGRRERRRAKKDWRRDDHAQRMAWLRDQRQAEPTSPAAIVALVVLLAIVILGIGGGLPRLLNDDETPTDQPIGLLTPGQPVARPGPTSESAASASTSPSSSPTVAPTTPSPVTERAPSAAVSSAAAVAGAWARAFYTRRPSTETYVQLVANCASYMTPDLADSLSSAGDPTYEALKADGGASTVLAAVVRAPQTGVAPVDTPTRISRFIKVSIDITGKTAQKIEVPLLVTVVLQGDRWVISDVSGGTGP